MSYYLQDSDSTLNGYPQVADLFPDGVQSKSELVDFLDEAFAEVKNDPEIEGVVNWVSYWTGFNANAGTVYALSTEYANQIGYNGPTTAKTQNFILVLDKYIEQNVRDLVAKMKKSKSVKNIDENEILSRGEYIGDTYYGEPYHSRRSKYYKYNDKFYEFTEGSDEYGGWEEVDSFVMTHPKPGYERYSASTKKSQDIHSMIAQIRKNNNSLKKSRVDLAKYRSVGPDYPLDVDRIVREMLDILIQSKNDYGDYTLDEYGAYEEWENRNYKIIAYDENGDEDWNWDVYNKLEEAFSEYVENSREELMDRVYELEYNDLISIAGREVYVKAYNDNDSWYGCKLWCGPNEDDEMGWYFDASDFEEVIRRSDSGERIFR